MSQRRDNSEHSSLPGGWTRCKGRDLFGFITSGSRGWAKHYADDGALFLRVGNLDHGSIQLDLTNVQRVRPPTGAEATRTKVASDDILISVTADIGMIAVVPGHLEDAYINQHIAVCRPVDGVDARFLAWYLSSESGGLRQLRQLQRGATKQGLGLDDIEAVEFPLAPLNEQRRIVAKIEELLSDLDAGVAALERAKANLKRYRAAVLKAAVEGKLTEAWRAELPNTEPASNFLKRILAERRRKWEADQLAKFAATGKEAPKNWKEKYIEPSPPDAIGLPELPAGWCWASAEQCCEYITKGTTPRPSELFEGSGDVPFIKIYNLTKDGSLDFSTKPTFISVHTHRTGVMVRSQVLPGDVLMNIVGPPLGKVAVIPSTFPEWNLNQAIAIFRPLPYFDRWFLCYSLLTEKILSWATKQAKATAGQFNLTLEIVRRLPLPLPPHSEQMQVVAEVAERLSQIANTEGVIDHGLLRAARLRQSILKQAFEGKLVTNNSIDEPAKGAIETVESKSGPISFAARRPPTSMSP